MYAIIGTLHSNHSHCFQGDELASQFTQMTLSRQGSSENPEPPPMYQPPPTVLSQHPPPQAGYIMATTGQPLPPPSGYQPPTGHPHPPPPPPPPSQTVIQAPPPPQGYIQPPPPQQVCGFNKRLITGVAYSFKFIFKLLVEERSSQHWYLKIFLFKQVCDVKHFFHRLQYMFKEENKYHLHVQICFSSRKYCEKLFSVSLLHQV